MPIALNFYSSCVYLLWGEQKMKEFLLCFYYYGLSCGENDWNTICALVFIIKGTYKIIVPLRIKNPYAGFSLYDAASPS